MARIWAMNFRIMTHSARRLHYSLLKKIWAPCSVSSQSKHIWLITNYGVNLTKVCCQLSQLMCPSAFVFELNFACGNTLTVNVPFWPVLFSLTDRFF